MTNSEINDVLNKVRKLDEEIKTFSEVTSLANSEKLLLKQTKEYKKMIASLIDTITDLRSDLSENLGYDFEDEDEDEIDFDYLRSIS